MWARHFVRATEERELVWFVWTDGRMKEGGNENGCVMAAEQRRGMCRRRREVKDTPPNKTKNLTFPLNAPTNCPFSSSHFPTTPSSSLHLSPVSSSTCSSSAFATSKSCNTLILSSKSVCCWISLWPSSPACWSCSSFEARRDARAARRVPDVGCASCRCG